MFSFDNLLCSVCEANVIQQYWIKHNIYISLKIIGNAYDIEVEINVGILLQQS